MVTLTIRDVPEETRQALADAARLRGQSLQAYLLGVLQQEAGFTRNRQILAEAQQWADSTDASVRIDDIVEVIRQGREDRDNQIMRAVLGDDDESRASLGDERA